MIPDVAYFILDYNPLGNTDAADKVMAAIQSVADNRDRGLNAELFLISQGCRENDHAQELSRMAALWGFHFFDLRENIGISRGINFAARMSRAKYICMVSSDCVITEGMDTKLIQQVAIDPKCQLAVPMSQKSEIPYQQYIPGCDFGDPNPVVGQPNVTCIAHEFSAVLWPREAFEQNVGYYDERWKACYENMDWALRAHLLGFNVTIVGDAFAWHSHAGCIKSGARDHSYDGYIDMPDGFDQSKAAALWRQKWPTIIWDALYVPNQPPVSRHVPNKEDLILPYVQDVGY